jgi:heme-degrading monooxygenase HmoA
MSIVKINALEIPPQAGDEIVKRFTARMDSLADVAGFLGFELLRPTGDAETRWFVYTRWTDQAAYEAWRDGDGARASHAGPPSGHGGPEGSGEGAPQPPVSMGATLLEFEVTVEAGPSGV